MMVVNMLKVALVTLLGFFVCAHAMDQERAEREEIPRPIPQSGQRQVSPADDAHVNMQCQCQMGGCCAW